MRSHFDKEARQARDCCVAKCATHGAVRPDPSLRNERLLGMTIDLHHYQRSADSRGQQDHTGGDQHCGHPAAMIDAFMEKHLSCDGVRHEGQRS
jgi:hypothetical protein